MDIKRYKSVAVQKEVWEKLWKIAKEESRSPSNQIEWFVTVSYTHLTLPTNC